MQRRTILLVLGALAIAAVIAVTTSMIVWRMAKRALTTTVTQVLKPEEKTIDIETLVTQVRELNRLETASMRVMHASTTTQSYKLVPNAIAGDELVFLAVGDVIAGVDLSQLRPQDVWRSPDGTVNLRLPPAQILVTRVDNEKSRVVSRKTGALRRADVNLETRARQNAEENIRKEALQRGVLTMAGDNAERKLGELIHSLGEEKVRFVGTRGVGGDR